MTRHIPTATRFLLAAIFLASGVMGLLGMMPPPEGADALTFMGALVTTKLIFVIKGIEITSAIALFSNKFIPAALSILAPVITGIGVYHLSVDPAGIPVAIVLLALWLTTAYPYRETFKSLFTAKPASSEEKVSRKVAATA